MNKELFIKNCKDRGLILTERQLVQFDTYAAYLKEYNEKINLTAITEYEEILEKHFFDSLLLSFEEKIEGSLVDVGTGAGFPGVVLKIAYPELKVTLVEPLKKRCVFLESLIERLDLKEIVVLNKRSEDLKEYRETFDYATARAVTNMSALIEITGALVKKGGRFIALRGQSGLEEIDAAKYAISQMGFVVENTYEEYLPDGAKRIISFMKKTKNTPLKFPRNYSMIKKKPL